MHNKPHTLEAKAKLSLAGKGRIPWNKGTKDFNKEKQRQSSWYQRNKEKIRNDNLLKRYGITPSQYDEMAKLQGNVCAICKKPETLFNGKLHVDHCHLTGKVRALLCSQCNTGIGKFNDDVTALRNAAEYIEKFRAIHNN